MAIAKLTDRAIRAAKATGKEYSLGDGGGLHLIVKPRGAKSWSFRYTHPATGKPAKIGLGGYPSVPLALARELAGQQRELVARGLYPRRERQREKERRALEGSSTFGVVAEAWYRWKLKRRTWTAEDSRARVRGLLDNHILPWFRDRPLADITRRDVAILLDRIVGQGLVDTPRRARSVIEHVYNYAEEFHEFPPEKNFLRGRNVGSLERHEATNHAALFEHERIGKLMRDIKAAKGTLLTRTALAVLPYVWQRPGMVRKMEWQELDLVGALWTIPADKMKQREEHLVPLPRQAIELLRDLQPLTGPAGRGPVFPNLSRQAKKASPFMSENTVNKALRRAGYDTKKDITGHGFRAMARTILPEELGIPEVWAERHLAHKTRAQNGTAYDRATYVDHRRDMVQLWADWLDHLRDGGDHVLTDGTGHNVSLLRRVA